MSSVLHRVRLWASQEPKGLDRWECVAASGENPTRVCWQAFSAFWRSEEALHLPEARCRLFNFPDRSNLSHAYKLSLDITPLSISNAETQAPESLSLSYYLVSVKISDERMDVWEWIVGPSIYSFGINFLSSWRTFNLDAVETASLNFTITFAAI